MEGEGEAEPDEGIGARAGVALRRACRIAPKSPSTPAPPPRASQIKQVASILRKKESLRTTEEVALLTSMKEIVQEVKFRIRRRQEMIDRNKEIEDEQVVLRSKCKKLASALQKAKHLVVYTGAGISTAADIPDYRGPNGIWTLLQQGKEIGKHDLTRADPTLTHMALWKLYKQRYLKFVVSQNCDGLHLRSGLPRRALSEVHGNMYIEICKTCKPNIQYWRLFDTTERTARYFHKTGRICHICGNSLEDSIVHFGERGVAQWPLNWTGALHHAAKADVILCLGSSLKVLKKYPWLWAMDKPIKKRPAVFIVNLQWTPKDDIAELKINGRCDNVMKLVMEYLGLETPKYNRLNDPIFAHTSYLTPKELHTTTQPMLIRNKPVEAHSKSDLKMDVDDPDDDCPLNILKLKMNVSCDKPEDLSLEKEFNNLETAIENNLKIKKCNALDCDKVPDGYCTSNFDFSTLKGYNELIENNKRKERHKNEFNSRLNGNLLGYDDVESDHNSKDCINGFDYLMDFKPEDFERVDLEMKTLDNKTCNVSILLLNKDKLHLNNDRSTEDLMKLLPDNLNRCKKLKINNNLYDNSHRMLKRNSYSKLNDVKTDSVKIKQEKLISSEPLDFCLDKTSLSLLPLKKNVIFNPNVTNKVFSKPLIVPQKEDNIKFRNSPLDLSTSNNCQDEVFDKSQVNNSKLFEFKLNNLKKLFSINPIDMFEKKCESFAKAIIQNTLSVNHKELQYAYSGLHSIINPIPFNMDYDFKGVFNSINFIRFAKKLLCQDRPGKVIKSSNANLTYKNDKIKKRKLRNISKRLCARKKREPQCEFCYENYKMYSCCFYEPYNSEKRFEKWRNGKLIMCDCCDTDSSEESDDESCNSDEDSKETKGSSSSKNEDDRESQDEKSNVDLKSGVQINISNKGSAENEGVTQAGWFGKGFRKNRRRKR